jgi:hypothetical protein
MQGITTVLCYDGCRSSSFAIMFRNGIDGLRGHADLGAGVEGVQVSEGSEHRHVDSGSGGSLLKADAGRLVHHELLRHNHRGAEATGRHAKDLISHRHTRHSCHPVAANPFHEHDI